MYRYSGFAGILILFSVTGTSLAENEIIGDERAITSHLQQAELNQLPAQQVLKHGEQLFNAKFTVLDGAGRPGATQAEIPVKRRPGSVPPFFRTSGPEANACNGCHNQPGNGGAGEFVANVFTSEGFSDFDFDTLEAQFSNERGTPHLHGSGFVELLAREMTLDLQAIRRNTAKDARTTNQVATSPLISKGISFGTITAFPDGFLDISKIQGVDHDLIVRPFSQKGVFTSLRQFSINALNAHHGIQSDERWGEQWTGTIDFDEDTYNHEISSGDVTSLVMFQALLPLPQTVLPDSKTLKTAVSEGQKLFDSVLCSQCHTPFLPLDSAEFSEPGAFNAAGNLRTTDTQESYSFKLDTSGLTQNEKGQWMIPVFSDFKRHVIADNEKLHFANERLSQRFIPGDVFLTARLWGVGSTAPFGHRGDVTTLREVIIHHGGEANKSRALFEALSDLEQRKVIEFLKSLQLPEQQS